ncbi:MAG: DUF1289 domain-containing protein [Pseudomonadota bacterium]
MNDAAPAATTTKRLPPSPCVGICTMNDDAGLCTGCGRDRNEITNWISLDDDQKVAIWNALPGRMAQLGATSFRLAPEPDQIAAFVRETLDHRAGRWVMGSTGASASFDAKEIVDVSEDTDWVTGRAEDGHGVRVKKHDRMRAFGLTLGDEQKRMMAVALVIPRGRAKLDQNESVTVVGPDENAIDPTKRSATLTDLATGRTYSRVLLRTCEAENNNEVKPFLVQSPDEVTDQVLPLLNRADFIVETALGRIESNRSDTIELVTSPVVQEVDADGNLKPAELDGFDDIQLSRAFAIGAVFHAHDPDWLVGRLTP